MDKGERESLEERETEVILISIGMIFVMIVSFELK